MPVLVFDGQYVVVTDLHHDDSQGDGEAGDTPHEGTSPNEGKGPRVHPCPGAGGQEHPRRSAAHHSNFQVCLDVP